MPNPFVAFRSFVAACCLLFGLRIVIVLHLLGLRHVLGLWFDLSPVLCHRVALNRWLLLGGLGRKHLERLRQPTAILLVRCRSKNLEQSLMALGLGKLTCLLKSKLDLILGLATPAATLRNSTWWFCHIPQI